MASPSASPALRPTGAAASGVVSLDAADVFTVYTRKYLGIDMMLKTVCNLLRLKSLYTVDAPRKAELDALILSIVDCRMLCNSMKPLATARQAWSAFQAPPGPGRGYAHVVKLLTVLSFAFRVGEQCFGDLSYLQKNWFSEWPRQLLSKRYKMYKSFSLLCCAILEAIKLAPYIARLASKAKAYGRHLLTSTSSSSVEGGRTHHRRASSSVGDTALGGMDEEEDSFMETASIVGSPTVRTPTDTPIGSSSAPAPCEAFERQPPPPPPPIPAPLRLRPLCTRGECLVDCSTANLPYLVRWTRHQHVRSTIFFVRNVADIVVYAQWIDSYRPYKTLEYLCGILSGALGVFIVWVDCQADMLNVAMC